MIRPDPATAAPRSAISWQVVPDWERELRGLDQVRLDEWLQRGEARIVKSGEHRTVYRLDLASGKSVFVKHYRCPQWLRAVLQVLRTSASRREFRKTWEVARRRVPTVRPVAVGEQHAGLLVRDSYFVSEALDDACSVDQWVHGPWRQMPPERRHRLRRELISSLAWHTAQAHRAGVYHNDFHTGNILLRQSAEGQLQRDAQGRIALFLIDLPSVRLTGPLSWRATRQSLVMLGSGWWRDLSRSDRWRFWRTYLRERPDLDLPAPDQAAADVHRRTYIYARQILRGRDQRALRNNRDYRRVFRPEGRGHVTDDFSDEALTAWLTSWSADVRSGSGQLPAAGGQHLSSVTFPARGWPGWWARRQAGRRAVRAWFLSQALLQRGIDTPRPLAVWLPRDPQLSPRVLYEAAGPFERLSDYLRGAPTDDSPASRLRWRGLIAAVAATLGRLHAWHLSHPTLNASLFGLINTAAGWRCLMLPDERLKICRRMSRSQQLKQLAHWIRTLIPVEGESTAPQSAPFGNREDGQRRNPATCWSRTDRLRFLLGWLRQRPVDRPDWKLIWRQLADHLQ